ncbi:MAG: acylphosphatase [Archaeoglobaceae archaeon]|nr:acylphosphatase [Archaeoglobaceae archaeon]MDW7990093.1 acylphosphatase [Archaeoglobaceae archaeon]
MALKITIKGKVHGVGYRVKLINIALEYGIERFSVFNTLSNDKESVLVLIDAPKEVLEVFKERIKIEKPEKAIIEAIEFEEYHYAVPPIERCMQAFQMEHWGKAIPIMLNMVEKQDLMIQKLEETREELGRKIDLTREELGKKIEMTREELGSKIESISEKLEETNTKLELLRSDFRDYLESNMNELNARISRIEDALRRAGIM